MGSGAAWAAAMSGDEDRDLSAIAFGSLMLAMVVAIGLLWWQGARKTSTLAAYLVMLVALTVIGGFSWWRRTR